MTTLNEVYPLLEPLGITKDYAKTHAMPDWWSDEADNDANCYLEGCGWLAKGLRLDYRSLLNGKPSRKP